MDNIHTLTRVKTFARQYWLVLSFVVLGAICLLGVRFNAESYHFGVYVDDEYHTVHEGLNLIVDGKVDNFRAQESVRWLVRAFYPYALVYLNTHMGGNVHIDGWSYPGHDYVIKNFVHAAQSPATFSLDPNLRMLFHALRIQYIFFVFVCVMALLYFFFKERYLLVAFGGVVLLGLNVELLNEQEIFYIEPGMLAALALLLLAYCVYLYRGVVSNKSTILFGFLAAFMIGTKFSSFLFIALPLVLFFYLLHYKDALRKTALYIGSFIGWYVVINFPAFTTLTGFNLYLHDLSSNFWHYAAGSDSSVTVASGSPYLGLLTYQLEGLLGYLIYVLPVIVLFAIYYASKKERMVLVPIAILTALSIYSLSGQHVYLPRNAVPFFLPTILIALLSIEILFRRASLLYGSTRTYVGVGVVSLLCLGGIVLHAGGVVSFVDKLVPNQKAGFVAELQSLQQQSSSSARWYAIGFDKNFFKGQSFDSRITTINNAPLMLNNVNYPEFVSTFSALSPDSIVLVRAVGNNTHITNYVLPKYFNRNIQIGGQYVFFNVR